jgi:predicted SAM-dependent methyltransferase
MHQNLRKRAKRIQNIVRKISSGLALTDVLLGDSATDLVQARLSLYDFVSSFSLRGRVVDLTAGSGFGAAHLAERHALSVVATDHRPSVVNYARSRYKAVSNVQFQTAPPHEALLSAANADVIFLSDLTTLDGASIVAAAKEKLAANGKLFIAASPQRGVRGDSPDVVTASTEWLALLAKEFAVTNVYVQLVPADGTFDPASPERSPHALRDFAFRQIKPAELQNVWPLTTLYMATNDQRFAQPKLQIGCGPQVIEGWINVDNQPYPGIDFLWDASRGLPFLNATHVFAEHFIEHLRYDDGLAFLRECRRVLSDEGRVRLSTPNLDWVIRACYRQQWADDAEAIYDCMSANRAFRGWGHQYVYNAAALTMLLREAGFATVERFGYGQSNDPVLANLERHEQYPDSPELPHILIVEGSGRALPQAPHKAIMDEYRRDIAVV